LQQLQREPALWIRAKAGTGAALTGKLSHLIPAPQSADALRYTGLTDLYRTKEFQAGEFEIQDLASQLVGLAAAPKPGETWWDACAGEGGKTMHLSDLMQNKGVLWASDRSVRRLAKLKDRAARAKVFNFRAAPWEGDDKLPTKAKFDGVLVDAPCSGVGTWQRNPHSRWTTLPKDVHELAAVQARLLNQAAGTLKPGGRLVYAVCTLTRAETTAVADAFTAAHPEFEPVAAQTLWPHDLNANGMFIAIWKKR
jgi:16S rRNA (cytosine967-C5)-methyltransferase